MGTIQVGLSEAFTGKALKPGISKDAYASSFQARTVTVEKFIAHIMAGNAWAIGTYTGDHRAKEHFIQSQVLALDLDAPPAGMTITSDVAALIHPTPSSTTDKPKYRVIFILDSPMTDSERWEDLQRACLYRYREWNPDASTKDCARFFFGAGQGEAQPYPERRVTPGMAQAWLDHYNTHVAAELERTKGDAPNAPALTGQPMEKYAEKAFQGVVADLRAAAGGERNSTLFKATCRALGFVRGGWPGMDEGRVLAELRSAARALGLPESELEATIKSAGKVANPAILPLDTSIAPVSLAEFDAPPMPPEPPAMPPKALLVSGTDAVDESERHYNQRLANPKWIIGMQSALPKLDMMIGGWTPGILHTFLGERGSGKSTMLASLAYPFIGQGKGLIVSCENAPALFIDRMVAYVVSQVLDQPLTYAEVNRACRMDWVSIGGLGGETPKITSLNGKEKILIDNTRDKIRDTMRGNTIQFTAPGNLSASQLWAAAESCRDQLQWVMIDSLNNILTPGQSMYENLTQAALMAKHIAQALNVTVACTAQIGRSTKPRSNKRIRIGDARDSGAIEEQSQRLFGLFNPWNLQQIGEIESSVNVQTEYSVGEGQVAIDLLKNNDGEVGRTYLAKLTPGAGVYKSE